MALHETRVPYDEIRAWTLEAYFIFCRDRGVAKRLSQLEVLGYAYDEFYDSFDRAIENLMFLVVILILSGGWHDEFEGRIRQKIASHLSSRNLTELLSEIPAEEQELFVHDLRILKLI